MRRGERVPSEQMADVSDPRAVPMIWGLFVFGSEGSQVAAISMLSQIEGPAASNALAALAIFSPRPKYSVGHQKAWPARPRDILSRLIGLVRKPFKYQVRPVSGPGSTGVLFVEGEKFNVQRVYRSMPIDPSLMPAGAQSFSAAVNEFDRIGRASDDPAHAGKPIGDARGCRRRSV